MRILVDECVPRRLKRELTGHDVYTVPEMGWSGKKNGELLALAAASGFEVLLTCDQGMPYQQNLQSAGIAIIILATSSNRFADLQPLMPSVLTELSSVTPGTVIVVTS